MGGSARIAARKQVPPSSAPAAGFQLTGRAPARQCEAPSWSPGYSVVLSQKRDDVLRRPFTKGLQKKEMVSNEGEGIHPAVFMPYMNM